MGSLTIIYTILLTQNYVPSNISDLPILISGTDVGILDPQEQLWPGDPGRQFELRELQGSSIIKALHGIVNFHQSSTNYPHTIFRLPLRTVRSRLSKNIYSVDKVKTLLNALRLEAKYLLLFLKSVLKIEVMYIDRFTRTQTFCVSIDSPRVDSERSHLLTQLHTAHSALNSCRLSSIFITRLVFDVKVTDNGRSSTSHWVVVNQVGSGNSEILEIAEELCIFPWVGTAIELDAEQADDGRVFCFLPLPSEVTSGLPVHVNGTFSLNDERRTLKWIGTERTNDTKARWNDRLIRGLLPRCYYQLLLLVRDKYRHEQFYQAWPDPAVLGGSHWQGLLQDLYQKLFAEKCVWSTESNRWVSIRDAFFIKQGERLSSVITRVLTKCHRIVVHAPDIVWTALEFSGASVTIITPELIRRELRNDKEIYRSESTEDKLKLLRFCLLDEQFSDLYDIALVPLANGKFATFSSRWPSSKNRYVCSTKHPKTLVPNQDNLLIDVPDTSLQETLIKVAKSEETQLKTLNTARVAKLLPDSFPEQWKGKSLIALPCPGFPSVWFETFWDWVQSRDLSHFVDLPVLPIATKSTRDGFSVTKLKGVHQSCVLIVPEDCPKDLLTAFKKLHVKCTITKYTPYVKHSDLSSYVHKLNHPGQILTAISNSRVDPDEITFSTAEAISLQECLAVKRVSILSSTQQTALKSLSIFKILNSSKLVSISTANSRSGIYQATVQPPGVQLSANSLPEKLIIFSRNENSLALFDYVTLDKPSTMSELLQTKVFPMISNGCVHSWEIDALMKEVIQLIPALKVDSFSGKIITLSVSELPFLPTLSNYRKAPDKLFDPSDKRLQDLFQGEDVFPLSPFNEKKYIRLLRECGLQTEVSAQQLLSILESVSPKKSSLPLKVSEQTFSRVVAVMDYISSHPTLLSDSVYYMSSRLHLDKVIRMFARQRSCLPVLKQPPSNYPKALAWKGISSTPHLVTLLPNVVCCSSEGLPAMSYLVGSEAYIVCIPQELSTSFSTSLDMNLVLRHFRRTIDTRTMLSSEDIDSYLKPLVCQVYSYLTDKLEQCLQARESNVFLYNEKWVWLPKKRKFIKPQRLALQEHPDFSEAQLEPYLYILPEELKEYVSLFESFGVNQTFSTAQIVSVLNTIRNSSSQIVPPRKQWSVVTGIMEWITDNGKTSASSKLPPLSVLYVPLATGPDISNPVLENVEEVVYTDMSFLRSFHSAKNRDCKFIHRRVSHLAKALGAKALSKQLNISQDMLGDVGPHESLVTRLKNILKDYQDGLTIIKELLQNADDAEATEVNILYDARSHQTDPSTLLYPGMAKCHGPALVVHNNGVFSDDDFRNIEKLAGATKSGQHLKIGKFGLGFCSVYHLTDIPSFVSRERLYIFDPTLEYLREENQDRSRPGKCLRIVEEIVSYSNQLDPYVGLFGFKHKQKRPYNGTMFRFPFRTESSELSRIKYNRYHVKQLMSDVKKAGSKLLLFLKHVSHITFSQIDQRQDKPTVILDIRKENKKTLVSVGDSLSESAAKLLSVEITEKSSTEQERWLVATYSSSSVSSAGSNKYGVSSVACSVQKTGRLNIPTSIEGEMFCFLPLSVKTGLPVHVSSNFAVKSDRSGIHASDEQQQSNEASWNTALMQSVVPQAYCLLLQALQGMCEDKTIAASDYKFTSLWPSREDLCIRNPWVEMVRPTYQLIMNNKLFYSFNREKWLMFSEIKVLSQSILRLAHRHLIPECVVKVMERLKYNLVSLSVAHQELLPTRDTSYIIKEEEFLRVFFANFDKFNDILQTRNKVLNLILLKFAETISSPHEKSYKCLKSYLTQHKCIPCKPDGKVIKRCPDVVDPYVYFASLYDDEDKMFPVYTKTDNELALVAMNKLGMLSESLPWKMIIERAKSIEELFKRNNEKALKRVKIILQCIYDNLKKSDERLPSEAIELTRISFLPVMAPPKSYPDFLSWQGNSKKLLSCQEVLCGGRNLDRLAGSQEAIICEGSSRNGGCGSVPDSVRSALNIKSSPTICAAVNHLCHFATRYMKQSSEKKQAPQIEKWIQESTADIFRFFEAELGKSTGKANDLKKLQEAKCIWTGREFVSPQSLAIKWEKNGPYLFKLPDILRFKEKLIKALNIQEKFTVDQLLGALKELYDSYKLNPMYDKSREMRLIEAVVSELDELISESGLSAEQTCYLPDENRVMRKVEVLAYNDAPWCKVDSKCFIVHHSIPRLAAQKLGVKLVRAKALESYESSEQHFAGVEFGQQEKLTQRINGILSEYPFKVTVFKELLQNADDAKAKKLYFILDKRTHSHHKLPSEKWKDLQGPALLVWNDMGFSSDDLKGIQKLGLGSKRSKSEAIGHYGIGFNVVYHLTDCPSFITNGKVFCVLDPHLQYVPGATELKPGRMYENLNDGFWNNWNDLKAPYLRAKLPGCPREIVTSGSLFRLPLRHKLELVKNSKLLDSEYKECDSLRDYPLLTADRMEQYLHDWAPKMKDALIFLNSVVELKFFVIKKNSEINLRFHFTAGLKEEALSKRLAIQHNAEGFRENRTPTSEFYTLHLSEEAPSKHAEKWLVKRGIGDSMKPDKHWQFLQQIRPNHGLATPVGKKDFQGNVFCFLPLPMHSSLPFHVNGSFILDAARSGLWQARDLTVDDDKTRWNNYLIEAIASSCSDFIVTCQSFYVESSYTKKAAIDANCRSYYRIFPYWSKPHHTKALAQSKETQSLHKETAAKEMPQKDESGDKEQELEPLQDEERPNRPDTWSGVMRTLARSTYKKLFSKNAKIHIVIKKFEPTPSKGSKTQPQYLSEWHPLANKEEPSKQIYFWSSSKESQKITQVLKRIGLHLSVAPIWIKIHFHQVGHDLPEATPKSVFDYYKNFFNQVIQNGDLPCPVKETSFHNVEDFKLFTEFILGKKEADILEFPDDPWGLPLLLTADSKLTFFKKEEKVIHTAKDYSSVFKSCSNCFLHPLLLEIKYNKSFFLESVKENWSQIQRILSFAVPRVLQNVHFVKEVAKVFLRSDMKLLWDCLTSEVVFRIHLEEILKEWALLVSTDGQGFSYKTPDQLLPVIPPKKPDKSNLSDVSEPQASISSHEIDPFVLYEVFQLLSKHNMPVLDISICDVVKCKKFCPEFSEPKAILSNMYHHYILYGSGTLYSRGILDKNVKKLFKYLAQIHFSQDDTSLTRVKALPLFRDISGCYKSLEKEACIWPGLLCMAGSDKWLNEHTTVFLPADGDWRGLAPAEVLRVVRISSLQLYTKFIFPSFGKFSHNERIAHLKHVRDTTELFDTAYAFSENEQLHSKEADLFVGALKQLPCLPIDGVLKPLNEFCDPESNIFKLFSEEVHFPPEDLRDQEWLVFFRKIGMRTYPTPKEFLSYCKKIASGDHAKILEASKVLVDHLCHTEEWHEKETFVKEVSAKEWSDEEKFLREVSTVKFVRAHKVPRLAWIKAPCPATNIVQQGKKSFSLTALRGSVVHSARNSKVVWTVRCLVELPRLPHTATKKKEEEDSISFLDKIGVSLDPDPKDVVSNLCNISHTGFADFSLFHKYKDKLLPTKRGFPLVEVIHDHFLYLRKADPSAALLSKLRDVPCIPVSQEGKATVTERPVLVKPVGVVDIPVDSIKLFIPYLNPLPEAFFDVTGLLASIGVNGYIQLKQVQFALNTIKEHIQDPYDPNTIAVLQELLMQLYSLLPNNPNKQLQLTSELKCPLYLPSKSNVLVDSRILLFNDLRFHRDASFNLHNVKFSFMSLLVRREEEHNVYNFTADDLYMKLPEHVQPQSLSKSCTVKLHEACTPYTDQAKQSDFVLKLRKAFKLPQFAEVVFRVIKHENHSEVESRRFSNHLDRFLKHLQVITVKGLKVNIFLLSVRPQTKIGTASTDFHFQKEQEDPQYTLYIEETVRPLRLIYLLERISEDVSQYVQEMSSCAVRGAEKIIGALMRAEDVKEVQEFLRDFRINTSDLQLEEPFDFSHIPKVGEEVPESWHHRLQCDINNCFRPQEMAALEVGEEQYIYVVVEHKVLPTSVATQATESESDTEEEEEFELDKYQIRVGENEDDTKVVSVVELYKLLGIKEVKLGDDTTEMVLYDSESTSVKMWDSVKGDKLKDFMREICSALRRIWKIQDEDEKRKAVKALYLKWHPDKNPHPLATKAFQFLLQQITRLEQGLPLEDPSDDWDQDTSYSRGSTSYYDFSCWDEIIRERNRTWQQEQSHHRSGLSFADDWTQSVRVYPEPDKAKVWFEQAEYDQQMMKMTLEKVSCIEHPKPRFSAHVCFLACQVAEKSIKAGMYEVCGLQPEGLIHHKYVGYAGALEQERTTQASGLHGLARRLENYYVKTRYPNAFTPHEAPSNRFGPSDAREAEMVAGQILEIIRKIVFA